MTEMLEEGEAKGPASAEASPGKRNQAGRPKTPGGTRLPIKNMSVGKLEHTLERTQEQIAIADEVELARIEAKKAASRSPSRSRGGSPTTRLSPSKDDDRKSVERDMGTHSKSSKSRVKKGVDADGMGGTDGMRSHKSTFMDPGKGEAKRYILRFECSDPFEYGGMECVTLQVEGQSFLLHHIRKMIAMTLEVVRGVIAAWRILGPALATSPAAATASAQTTSSSTRLRTHGTCDT